ncbi:hypothetical protein [Thiocapsa marina]|uniref:PD-(D/E)XK nuclease superfamily protein n=1 Tax=Thiocapsa marina 5811 TaxID=768671 RepID=F9UE39_9GAMM|nr:hypothetical protein [Thiocapsa marina]EGV17596.1 hypothetical protein ThimaDRAFT_3141 [Thiocapsa marina 5811]
MDREAVDLGSAAYHEIAPHLVLMAFLHRVANGEGTPEREYAIGSGRMDLCLRYGAVTLGIELKVWRDGAADPLEDGLAQLDGSLAGLGLDGGWLVIFDPAPASRRSPSARAAWRRAARRADRSVWCGLKPRSARYAMLLDGIGLGRHDSRWSLRGLRD